VPARGPSLLRPSFLLALVGPVPGVALRLELIHVPLIWETTLFGVAILGAAFLLAWAAEVAQLDISQTLAIAVLALIAVLPEYAVDLVLAYRAGQGDEELRQLAVANMTGANRLLIGVGWAAVVLIFFAKNRRDANRPRTLTLRPEQRTDVGFLLVATLWAFTIPIRGEIGLLDLAILGGLFVAYIFRAAREELEEPELIGAAAALGALPTAARRATTVTLFLYAAAAILFVAEPFAEGLIEIGISTFLLIQWVAPLASEAPEMIIAILFTLRLKAQAGMGTLISSKVNQWTLLIGTLGLVYSIGAGQIDALHFDFEQKEEVFLTAAQSLFAVAVISNLSITRNEALIMLTLFFGQFLLPYSPVRIGFGIAYILLAVGIFAFSREARGGLVSSLKHVFEPIRRPRGRRAGPG
jgi:cation:H+ antiporter